MVIITKHLVSPPFQVIKHIRIELKNAEIERKNNAEQLRALRAEFNLEHAKRTRAEDELTRAQHEVLRLKSLNSEGRALSDISQKVAKAATLDQAAVLSEKQRLGQELDEAPI